ncbi:hypothetical protein C9994_10975 [Marivirga lumbricoides]|uniref:Thiamine pyrophosphokinase n=1 Tax=Marivirga lumbricoides TaxID=1046115 RepID=A0A2T4DP62_9BACT|nr:hypothetical protein C9994_10975 [Marivirga lumbricoides]
MSSHHVIRDEQEPPIFILSVDNNLTLIRQLLGWSPTVWVSEEHAEWVMSQNIKVDGVFAIDPSNYVPLDLQTGNYAVKKFDEGNMLSSLISVLEDKEFTGINIFCNKLVRENLLKSVFNQSLKIPISIFVEEEITVVSFKNHLKKWYPSGSRIHILSGELQSSNTEKQSEGFVVKEEGFIQIESESSPIIFTEF